MKNVDSMCSAVLCLIIAISISDVSALRCWNRQHGMENSVETCTFDESTCLVQFTANESGSIINEERRCELKSATLPMNSVTLEFFELTKTFSLRCDTDDCNTLEAAIKKTHETGFTLGNNNDDVGSTGFREANASSDLSAIHVNNTGDISIPSENTDRDSSATLWLLSTFSMGSLIVGLLFAL
jgi:hypothetical protein